jgi:hypothetical protein
MVEKLKMKKIKFVIFLITLCNTQNFNLQVADNKIFYNSLEMVEILIEEKIYYKQGEFETDRDYAKRLKEWEANKINNVYNLIFNKYFFKIEKYDMQGLRFPVTFDSLFYLNDEDNYKFTNEEIGFGKITFDNINGNELLFEVSLDNAKLIRTLSDSGKVEIVLHNIYVEHKQSKKTLHTYDQEWHTMKIDIFLIRQRNGYYDKTTLNDRNYDAIIRNERLIISFTDKSFMEIKSRNNSWVSKLTN